jgi:hypothetical protein
MYVIKALVIIRQCLTTSQKNDAQLWHQRYGHLSSKGINVLVQKGTVHGLPSVKESNTKCANCMKGKQQREVFPKKSSRRASIKLELIHSDICGPINLESNEKKRYFITSTDDLTMKTWIYFLNEKFEALTMFQKFKVMIENESNHKIQWLKTDRGGSTLQRHSMNFVIFMTLKDNLQLVTPLNKIGFQKGKIEPS